MRIAYASEELLSHLKQLRLWFEGATVVSFLVVYHIALVVISVLTAVPALESLLTHMDVHLVRQKRLPGDKSLSTVGAVESFVNLSCVHHRHVKVNFSEHAATDVAGCFSKAGTSIVVPESVCIFYQKLALWTLPWF